MLAPVCCIVTVWSLDNEKPYTYYVRESYAIPSPAHEGESLTVCWKIRIKNRLCPGTNRRILFDPESRAAFTSYDPVPLAQSHDIRGDLLCRSFALPRRVLPTGPVGYRAHLSLRCNPLQYIWPLEFDTPDLLFQYEGAK